MALKRVRMDNEKEGVPPPARFFRRRMHPRACARAFALAAHA